MVKSWIFILFLPLSLIGQYTKNLEKVNKYVDDNDLSKAISELEDLKKDSDNHEVNQLLGSTLFKAQKFELAALHFKNCLGFINQEQSDYQNLYLCYNQLEDTEKAEKILSLMRDYFEGVDSSLFYTWASLNLNSPCTPDFGIRESLRYCVNLDAGESVDPLNPNQVIYWETDDNKNYSGPKISHCFAKSGKHSIKIITEDNSLGYLRRSDTTIYVTFLDNNSIILKQEEKNSPQVEVSTYKIDTDSLSPYLFVWETGDGHIYFDEVMEHKYYEKGEYTIKLTIFEKLKNGTFEPICCFNKKCSVNKP